MQGPHVGRQIATPPGGYPAAGQPCRGCNSVWVLLYLAVVNTNLKAYQQSTSLFKISGFANIVLHIIMYNNIINAPILLEGATDLGEGEGADAPK